MTANEIIEQVKKGIPLVYSTLHGSELYQLHMTDEYSIMLNTSVAESVVKKLNLKKEEKQTGGIPGMKMYYCV